MNFGAFKDKQDRTRELKSRLVPRQQLLNKPITLNSCFGTNRPKTRTTVRPEPASKLPPISPHNPKTPKRLEPEEPEPNIIPDNFENVNDFINYVKRKKAKTLYVYLWPSGVIEDSEHPSNLEIIPPNKVNKDDFITLSYKGISHIRGDNVDFIPLDEWLDGNVKFSKLLKIPFFKNQRQWRHFRAWKSLVQASKIRTANRSLTRNLFFTDGILREAFLQIQGKLNELQSMKLFSLQPTGKYRINHFVEDNKKHTAKMNQILTDMNNYIIYCVNEACERTRESLNSPEKEYGKDDKAPLEAMIQHYKKTKSAPGANLLENFTNCEYTKKASYRAACTKLVRFIRLVDYNVINALRTLCFNSLLAFLSIFECLHERSVKSFNCKEAELTDEMKIPVETEWAYQAIKQRTKTLFETPIFWVDMKFDGTITWIPSTLEIKDRIEQVRNESIDILFKVPRLLTNPMFANYIASDGCRESVYDVLTIPDLGRIIFNDSIFKEISKHMSNLLISEQTLLDHYNKTFDQPVNIYNADKKYDLYFMNNPNVTANDIAEKIKALRSEESFLRNVVESKNVGIFFCVSAEMKKNLITSPGICIDLIKRMIPEVFKRNLQVFERHMKEAFHDLSVIITNVQVFVDFIDATNRYNQQLKSFVAEQQALTDLNNLAIIQSVIIPQDDIELFTNLGPILDNVKTILATAESKSQDNKEKFIAQLEEDISDLHKNVVGIRKLADDPRLGDIETSCNLAAQILVVLIARSNHAMSLATKYNNYRTKMGLAKAKFDDVEAIQSDVNFKQLLWETKTTWNERISKWFVMTFQSVNPSEFSGEIEGFKDAALRARKALPNNSVAEQLDTAINDVANLLPAINDLKNKHFNNDHRAHIEGILGTNIFSSDHFTIEQLFNIHTYNYVDQIHTISVQATNEKRLLDIMNEVSKTIDALQFGVHTSKWQKSSYELSEFDEVITTLDDAMASIDSILASQYVAPLRVTAESWKRNLRQMLHIVKCLEYVQEKWCFISSIFPSGIRPSPQEFRELSSIEKIWRVLSSKINDDPSVLRICLMNQTSPDVESAKESIQKLLKSVQNELDNKRANYPRFFFISNNQLLNIITHSKDPNCILKILPQITDGVSTAILELDNRVPCITGVSNNSGELLELRPVKFRSSIDMWLSNIEEITKRTIKNEFKSSKQSAAEMTLQGWIKSSISQITKMISHVDWTSRIKLAFQATNVEDALTTLYNETNKVISNYSQELCLENTSVEALRLSAQIALSIYHRDKTQLFIKEEVSNENDYQWFKQPKFTYNDQTKDITVTIGNYSFIYDNEFSDCSSRTIVSVDSDMAFLTISAAIKHFFGAAIFGEAESGKTETLKEIARTLGVFCYIVNCTNMSTIEQISRTFKGAVTSNSWICYKNIDLIPITASSILTDYIRTVHNFAASGQRKCDLLGTEIQCPQQMGVFITYNTGSKPISESLQAYFRPLEYNNPPLTIICESILWSQGFTDTVSLANKISALLSDLSSLFSTNKSYSFGARTLKFILDNTEPFKQSNKQLTENEIIFCATKAALSQMISNSDAGILNSTIENFFPDIDVDAFEIIEADTVKLIKDAAEDLRLTPSSSLVNKAMQIKSLLNLKKGIILYGHTASGKTVALQTLQNYFNRLRTSDPTSPVIQLKTVYSGMMTNKQMFGEVNLINGVWEDGVVSKIIKSSSVRKAMEENWICIDGTIDDDWTTHFATSLSDEPFFEIENSEHVALRSNIHFFFETTDISRGTPALFAQCGLVYFEYRSQGYHDVVESEKKKFTSTIFKNMDKIINLFNDLIDRSFFQGIAFNEENGSPIKDIISIATITAFFKVYRLLLNDITINEEDQVCIERITIIFIFAFLWVFGGHLDTQRRQLFDQTVRDVFQGTCQLPQRGILFDWSYNINSNTFQLWNDVCPRFSDIVDESFEVHPQSLKDTSIFVPTGETERSRRILSLFIRADFNILVRGPPGSCKTKICKYVINELSKAGKIAVTDMQLTNYSSAEELMKVLTNNLERKNLTTLYPVSNIKKIIVLEGIDAPTPRNTGEKTIFEFIRSVTDCGGSYFFGSNDWKSIENTKFFGIGHDDGYNKPFISGRSSRHFINYELSHPDSNTIFNIMHSVLSVFFNEYDESVRVDVTKIVNGTIFLYEQLSTIFTPSTQHPHYLFNMHDISRVMLGLLRATPEVITDGSELQTLWAHEVTRVFCDKLYEQDKPKFMEQMLIGMKKIGLSQNLKTANIRVFGHFKVKSSEELDEDDGYQEYGIIQPYSQFRTIDQLTQVFQNHVDNYQLLKRITDDKIVMFNSQSEHIARIHRVLSKPLGHIVLLGKEGTGKHISAKVACSLACVEYVDYNTGFSFRDDLKGTLQKSISGGKGYAIAITEEMMLRPEVAADVVKVLHFSALHEIYSKSEFDSVLDDCISAAKAKDQNESKENLNRIFADRVNENLHLLIFLDNTSPNFLKIISEYPSLISMCTFDTFGTFQISALQPFAEKILTDSIDNKMLALKISKLVGTTYDIIFHQNLEGRTGNEDRLTVTPALYVHFFDIFVKRYKFNTEKTNKRIANLQVIMNLVSSIENVIKSNKELIEKIAPNLTEKKKAVSKLDSAISVKMQKSGTFDKSMQNVTEEIMKKEEEVKRLKKEHDALLNKYKEALEESANRIKSLTRTEITEIINIEKPSPTTAIVMDAACVIMGKEPSWENAKELLYDSLFVFKFASSFSQDNQVADDKLQLIIPYTENEAEFSIEAAEKEGHIAIQYICRFILDLAKYEEAIIDLIPKQQEVQNISNEIVHTTRKLTRTDTDKSLNSEEILKLQKQRESANLEACKLAAENTEALSQIETAEELLSVIGDEVNEWRNEITELKKSLPFIIGDSFLQSVVLLFGAPLSKKQRNELISTTKDLCRKEKLMFSESFEVIKSFTAPHEIAEWHKRGLPLDSTTVENFAILMNAPTTPFIIDPNETILNVIKNIEEKNTPVVMRIESNFTRVIEASIRSGTPTIVLDVKRSIPSIYDNILAKNVIYNDGKPIIRIGERVIEYDEKFRMYVFSKYTHQKLSPGLCTKATVVDFSPSEDRIKETSLSQVVNYARKELETELGNHQKAKENEEAALKVARNRAFELLLAADPKSILEDNALINELIKVNDSIKTRTANIKVENEEIEEIQKERNEYTPAANRLSVLIEQTGTLANLNPLYEFGSKNFKFGLKECLHKLPNDTKPVDAVTFSYYESLMRSVFAKHRSIISFLFCTEILVSDGRLKQKEVDIFLSGPNKSVKSVFENPLPNLISDEAWTAIQALAKEVPAMKSIPSKIMSDNETFSQFLLSKDEKLPEKFKKGLSDFQLILFFNIFMPSAVPHLMINFVAKNMSTKFSRIKEFTISDVTDIVTAKTPIMIYVNENESPLFQLQALAVINKIMLRTLSLAHNKANTVEQFIQSSIQKGEWVYLENLNNADVEVSLVLGILISKLKQATERHPTFKLFVSVSSQKNVPHLLIDESIKFAFQNSIGIPQTFTLLIHTIPLEMYGKKRWTRFAFLVAVFHAVLDNRLQTVGLPYIPLTFNTYEDALKTVQIISKRDAEVEVSVAEARDSTISCIYGNHIIDEFEKDSFQKFVVDFFSDDHVDGLKPLTEDGSLVLPRDDKRESFMKYLDNIPESINYLWKFEKTFDDDAEKVIAEGLRKLSTPPIKQNPLSLIGETLKNLNSNLPTIDDISAGNEIISSGDLLTPCLRKEAEFLRAFIEQIQDSIEDISNTERGLRVLTQDIFDEASALAAGNAPSSWRIKGSPKNINPWLADIQKRASFINSWIRKGRPQYLLLSAFREPTAVFTCIKQIFAKELHISTNNVHFIASLTIKEPEITTTDTIWLKNVTLKNAAWNESAQMLSMKGETENLWLKLTGSTEQPQEMYNTPVYVHKDVAATVPLHGGSEWRVRKAAVVIV